MKKCAEYMSSRWAYLDEICDIAESIEIQQVIDCMETDNIDELKASLSSIIKGAGIPVAFKDGTLYVSDRDIHSIIFGSTGSMKTRRVVLILLILLILNGESIVVNDPKGELYRRLHPLLEKLNCPTAIYNYRDSRTGNRHNFLAVAYELYHKGETDKCNEYLRDFGNSLVCELSKVTSDIFWSSMAANYFVGLAQVLIQECEKKQCTLEGISYMDFIGTERYRSESVFNEYFKNRSKASLPYRNLNGIINTAKDTQGGILSIFRDALAPYVSQECLCDMMSESDFDFSLLGEQQSAIFIIAPDEKSTYNAVVAALIKQCYQRLIDTAENKFNGFLPIRVNFVLDEFGNLPQIDDMNSKLTASRSRNIRFNLVLQSASQLYSHYGNEMAEILMGNCDAWLYLNTKDLPLLNKISELCGNYRSNWTQEERPLINVSQLQRLSKENGEALLLLERNFPYMTYLPDIDEYSFDFLGDQTIEFTKRDVHPRSLFDIRSRISNSPKIPNPPNPFVAHKEKNTTDIDELVKRIDQKILELEAEEQAEKERMNKEGS